MHFKEPGGWNVVVVRRLDLTQGHHQPAASQQIVMVLGDTRTVSALISGWEADSQSISLFNIWFPLFSLLHNCSSQFRVERIYIFGQIWSDVCSQDIRTWRWLMSADVTFKPKIHRIAFILITNFSALSSLKSVIWFPDPVWIRKSWLLFCKNKMGTRFFPRNLVLL